ncbi:MAG: DUF1847 domain-containing protein [Candidatus Helarchaeota archaeon]|nr:DUF1847 domain-containing protein [Candidatus Helarchaeota archaeon]
MDCANCKKISCLVGSKKSPPNCPMTKYPKVFEKAKELYEDPENELMARSAGIVEATGYLEWPRLKDTIEFAKLMRYKKLGLAFCIGLFEEAQKIQKILEVYRFEVSSSLCKTGCFTKSEIGDIPKEYQMTSKTGYAIGFVSCNPIAQALLLNETETEFNIIVGLCVGHDSLFIKYSKAPVTVLIAKDRRLAHNPAAVLYTYYYNKFFHPDQRENEL